MATSALPTPYRAIFDHASAYRGHGFITIDDYRVAYLPDGSAQIVLWKVHDTQGQFEIVLLGARDGSQYLGGLVEPNARSRYQLTAFTFDMSTPAHSIPVGRHVLDVQQSQFGYAACVVAVNTWLGATFAVIAGIAGIIIGGVAGLLFDGVCQPAPAPKDVFWEGTLQNVYVGAGFQGPSKEYIAYTVYIRGCDPVKSTDSQCYVFSRPNDTMTTVFIAEHVYSDGTSFRRQYAGDGTYHYYPVESHSVVYDRAGVYVTKVVVDHMNELTIGQFVPSGSAKVYTTVN